MMPHIDAAGNITVEALRVWWGVLCWASGLGLAWVLWVWLRVRALQHHGGWTPDQWDALGVRLRDASYRVLLKTALTAFVVVRWDIFQTATPSVLDWRQALDAAFLTLVIAVLTAWSLHQFVVIRRRLFMPRPDPASP